MQVNPKFKLLGSLLTTKGIALPSARQIVQRKIRLHSHLLLTSQQSCRIAGRRDEVCHRCFQRTEGNSLLSAWRCDVRWKDSGPREREVALDPFRLTPGQKGNSSIASFSEQSRRQARMSRPIDPAHSRSSTLRWLPQATSWYFPPLWQTSTHKPRFRGNLINRDDGCGWWIQRPHSICRCCTHHTCRHPAPNGNSNTCGKDVSSLRIRNSAHRVGLAENQKVLLVRTSTSTPLGRKGASYADLLII